MSSDELTKQLVVLMRKHETHLQAAMEAVTKLGSTDNALFEFMKRIPDFSQSDYDELMANAIKHDNARDQLLEAWALMKEDVRELTQAMLKAAQ